MAKEIENYSQTVMFRWPPCTSLLLPFKIIRKFKL